MRGSTLAEAYAEVENPDIGISQVQTLSARYSWSDRRKLIQQIVQELIDEELEKASLEQANAIQHAREAGRREGAQPGSVGQDEMMEIIDGALQTARDKAARAKKSGDLRLYNSALETINKALLTQKKVNSRAPITKVEDVIEKPADDDPFDATEDELADIEAALQES